MLNFVTLIYLIVGGIMMVATASIAWGFPGFMFSVGLFMVVTAATNISD